MKPVVAIIGRPNVGKSTLFNRLAGGSKAIVIDEPGATRDRNYAECTWNDRPFTLIDTGGFEPASEVEILVQMREQTKLAIEEADIILFLMDGRDGLTPADQEISRMLRMVNKTVFYAVNKVDGPRHEALVAEFYRLGVERLYPLSAQHGPGLDELMDDVAARLPVAEPLQDGEGERIRIAVVGRPNVGKSSLPNALVLALMAGVLEAVPMIGPLLGAIPAAVIALSIAPSKLVWVIVATLIIQQMENSLLVPRVMRKAVGVNPFVTLLALFAFGSLFGIAGALMAIPIVAIIQLLLDRFVFHPTALEPEVSAGRDYASRLRYEAQALAQDLRKQARLKKGGSDQRVKQIDQVMDEIEAITTDRDALLAEIHSSGAP